MYPVVILAGKAKSGKDTVASFFVKNHGAVTIAQADPLKRYAKQVFGFSDEQLWGPSETRNAMDPRFADPEGDEFKKVETRAYFISAFDWLRDVGLSSSGFYDDWIRSVIEYGKKNGLNPRHVLQTLGTEFGRRQRSEVWVDYAQKIAHDLLLYGGTYDPTKGRLDGETKNQMVVITDGRFRNEVLATKAAGGIAIKVSNPDEVALAGAQGTHQSETEQDSIPPWWFDFHLVNDKSRGLNILERAVATIDSEIRHEPRYVNTKFFLPKLG